MQAEEIFEKMLAEQLCCMTMSAGTSPTADLHRSYIQRIAFLHLLLDLACQAVFILASSLAHNPARRRGLLQH